MVFRIFRGFPRIFRFSEEILGNWNLHSATSTCCRAAIFSFVAARWSERIILYSRSVSGRTLSCRTGIPYFRGNLEFSEDPRKKLEKIDTGWIPGRGARLVPGNRALYQLKAWYRCLSKKTVDRQFSFFLKNRGSVQRGHFSEDPRKIPDFLGNVVSRYDRIEFGPTPTDYIG